MSQGVSELAVLNAAMGGKYLFNSNQPVVSEMIQCHHSSGEFEMSQILIETSGNLRVKPFRGSL